MLAGPLEKCHMEKLEQILRIGAYGVGGLYFAGIVVSATYLMQYGIYDNALLQGDYLLKGISFVVHLAIPLAFLLLVFPAASFALGLELSHQAGTKAVLIRIAAATGMFLLIGPVAFLLGSAILCVFRVPDIPSGIWALWTPYWSGPFVIAYVLLLLGLSNMWYLLWRKDKVASPPATLGLGFLSLLVGLLLSLIVYGTSIYPIVDQGLGGGRAARVEVRFSPDLRACAGTEADVVNLLLIHETPEYDYFSTQKGVLRVKRDHVQYLRILPVTSLGSHLDTGTPLQ